MFLFRLKTAAALLLAIGIFAVGLRVLAQPPSSSRYDEQIRQLERQLDRLKRVREMEISQKEAQQKAVAELQKLGAVVEWQVVSINLVATKVTDEDLKLLTSEAFPHLQTLHLHHTNIGDAGLANLKGLKTITHLDLFDTRVTDSGLEHLRDWMPYLEVLELSDTKVTDAALRSLIVLGHLRRLDVRNTQVTKAGVEETRRALPGLEILH
jgi:hypothetical protein